MPPPATGTNAQATVAAAGEGDAITPAEPLAASQRRPEYPPAARREGLEGTTELRVRVGAGGRVEHVAVARSSGHAELDAAATVAVARWRFVPARYRGQPVADQVLVTITFDLDDESWESD